jgi:hypothetical protein
MEKALADFTARCQAIKLTRPLNGKAAGLRNLSWVDVSSAAAAE